MRDPYTLLKRSVALFLLAAPLQATALSDNLGFFANGKEVFRPLLADPREVQLALRLVTPVGRKNWGEIAAGDYFGLYRWALPLKDSYLQLSAAGGVFARFDLVSEQKDLQVIDFTANMPLDLRVGKWAFRLLPYHVSSHLGDDYIKRTGVTTEKYTFDSFRVLASLDASAEWRIYGGYQYTMRNISTVYGRSMLQAGFEYLAPWSSNGHAQMFWANDFQSWERIGWNPIFNTQLGVRFAKTPDARQRLAVFTEYGAGHLSIGQFYRRKESHWVLGLRMEV